MLKEKSDFKFWKRISEFVKDNRYTYIDSYKYNDVISQVALETYHLMLNDDIQISLYDYLKRKNEEIKAFIYIVLEDILFNDNFEPAFHLINVIQNKEIIEEALNTISVQLTHKDYEFPTYNDYSKNIDDFKNQLEDKSKNHQDEYSILNKINKKQNFNSYNDKKLNVHMVHNSIYDELKRLELAVWRDAFSNSLYFRVKPYDEKQKTDKTKLSDFLTILLNRNIDIYSDTSEIKYQKSDFLIVSLLPMVKMEVYDPLFQSEFIHIQNNMYYKNTFRYTKFLEKRFNTNNQSQFPLNRNNTIVKFIEVLSQNQIQSGFLINWIASFYQLMAKNNTASVLIGDNETTEILVNNVIKPIFAFKESDFCTINNDTLKDIDDLSLQNKIFYHIDDISGTPSNCKKASKIVKQLLKTTPTYNESIEREVLHIHGQVIVTADKHNPYPFLKDSYSRCIVFKVKNLKTILKSFQLESLELEEKIKYDLDDFCNSLSSYNCNFAYFPKTSEKELLKQNQFDKIKQPDISMLDIQEFIKAIKNHQNNRTYFNPIKVDTELYDELIHNFKENMIARPILYKYFNMIHQEEIFTNNEELLKILRDEDDFFAKDIDKNKQYKRKKRYILPEQIVQKNHTKIVQRRKFTIVKKTKPKKVTRYIDKYKNKKNNNNVPHKKTSIYHKLFKK